MSVEKIRRVANVKDFDFINPNDYNISMDTVNRKLKFEVKDGVDNSSDIVKLYFDCNLFDSLRYDILYYESEDGVLYSLFNVFAVNSNPLTFSFNRGISNAYITDITELRGINKISLKLFSVLFPPIKRKVELKDMAISLDFSNNSFTMVAENKSGLSVVNFRQKVLSCVKLLSLIFYSPLRIERECLFSGDLNYEYIYDAKESGRAITRLIPVNMTDVLLKGVFTQDNIEKFITNFDKDYSNLLTIYIYLLDKMNLNIRNINDFFLIQLIVSLISKLKGEWVDSKEAIDLYLNNGYIKQFNFDKDRDEAEKVLSELLRDERNYVGHLFVLYDRKNSRKRKYTGSDCLEIHDFFRLLLSVPFYIYEIFGMAISDEIITNVLDGFKSYWS